MLTRRFSRVKSAGWNTQFPKPATPAKKISITGLTGQMFDGGGWAAFSYTLEETTAQGAPNQMKGTNSLTFKKAGNDWQVVLIHAAVNGPAIAPH